MLLRSSGLGESRRFQPLENHFVYAEYVQVDILSFYFAMGSSKSGHYHGMGNYLVIRKCLLTTCEPFLQTDLVGDSYRNLTTLLIRIYSLLPPL